MDQIVNWLSLFQEAHTTLVQFVTALGVALVTWASVDLVFIGYRKFREVCDHLSYSMDDYTADFFNGEGEMEFNQDGIDTYHREDGSYNLVYGDEHTWDDSESDYGFEDNPDSVNSDDEY